VRPIAHLDKTEMLRRETVSLHCHLGETEIPIGETELIRVSGSGYVKGTRWRRIDQIGGAEFDFRFRTYLELREWLRALEHITKHFEQVDH
jgi:hypothetical protein